MKKDWPNSRNDLDYEEEQENALHALEQFIQENQIVTGPEELEALERNLSELLDQFHAVIVGDVLQRSIESEPVKEAVAELIECHPKKLKNQGTVRVMVRTASGILVPVWVSYYCRKCDGRKKRRQKGLYGALAILGIHERCTPWFASHISETVAVASSIAEAQKVLSGRGIILGIKRIRNLAYRYVERAKAVQKAESYQIGESVTGRRVVISTDGGRLRIRRNNGGKRTAKGRLRYSTKWREPKLLIIYVVNSEGKMEKQFAPFIDGTMKGPDALFALMQYYLRQLSIEKADRILFTADGAKWIWNRIPDLVKALGLHAGQVHELLDFYHAVEHLGKVSALRRKWSKKQRKTWVTRQRRLLLAGEVDKVIEAVQVLCRGRKSKEIRTERDYFIRNRHRMQYAEIASLQLPIGSGSIESAVRRVINLRLKGASIYWRRENAEVMLTLRSFYKSGRWNLLKDMANSPLSLLAA
jgi:hypothetical protein